MFDAALSPMVATHLYRNRDLLFSADDTMHIRSRHLNVEIRCQKVEKLVEKAACAASSRMSIIDRSVNKVPDI